MSTPRFSFPFRSEGGSLPTPTTEEDSIASSLRLLLSIPRGERVMRCRYGVNTALYVFENNDRVLEEAIRFDVVQAIRAWEPRVLVTQVTTQRDLDEGVVSLTIEYIRVADRTNGIVTVAVG